MTHDRRPPASAELFAAALIADPGLREAVLGDLAEEHHDISSSSSASRADAWYRWQLIRSAIPFSLMAVSRGGAMGWVRLVIAVVAGYACVVALVLVTNAWLYGVLNGANSWQMPAASLVAGIGCAAVSGYVAAVIGGRSPVAPSLAFGLLCVAISVLMLSRGGDGSPVWYQLGLAVIVLPGAIAGSMVRARQIVGRANPQRRTLS